MKHLNMPLVASALLAATQPHAVLCAPRAEGGAGNLEALLKEVKQELDRIGNDVRKTADTAFQEAKNAGKLSDETKAKADSLLTAQNALQDSVAKLQQRLEDMDARNLDIEQRMSGRRGGGTARQTLGQAISMDAQVKAFNGKGTITLIVQNAITSGSASAGPLIAPQRETEIVGLPRRQVFVRDLLSRSTTNSNLVQYARMKARTNAAGVVAEGALKPESGLEYEAADAPVRTIAHWIPVSRQALEDADQLQGEIDGELRYGLDLTEEAEILSGDGEGQHLSGLITNASAYSGAYEPAGATAIDKLRFALLEASLALYPADGMVLNEIDWALIETAKDSENRYIFANPLQLAGPVLWGRPVVPTTEIDEDKFLVGAFRAAATIYDRMDTEVLISSEDRDNFVKNMLTVRAEKRLALAIKRAAALIYGDFGRVA
ncbi:phage major capsid protein [Cereibacter sphaeroides]|jgi:HK97 family phage major capsid protein|uniref:phage major capsid protein n=1 Tax=Cereibacter sphaeroides TaxID=1063 RepID=UPI00006653B7|nr:phage major capsid protein, HK97 family [Cereibacter sphaeroides ATCC 17029]